MAPAVPYVEETRFGKWFLQTETWRVHVLERALRDLLPLIPQRRASYPVVVDVGCGSGSSLPKLAQRFAPHELVGVDLDAGMLVLARAEAQRAGIAVRLVEASSTRLPLADACADLLFCHQTFHHLVEQEAALAEFLRVLKPGGLLLFAESTRRYIHSWIIRALFRHPMEVQRSAPEYLGMLRAAGFVVPESAVSYPYLWWSRGDLGILERWFGVAPPADREETLVNLVAVKPA
jgi:ubiquinone/menaquinone biosynthesis C-methylase UbiE